MFVNGFLVPLLLGEANAEAIVRLTPLWSAAHSFLERSYGCFCPWCKGVEVYLPDAQMGNGQRWIECQCFLIFNQGSGRIIAHPG